MFIGILLNLIKKIGGGRKTSKISADLLFIDTTLQHFYNLF